MKIEYCRWCQKNWLIWSSIQTNAQEMLILGNTHHGELLHLSRSAERTRSCLRVAILLIISSGCLINTGSAAEGIAVAVRLLNIKTDVTAFGHAMDKWRNNRFENQIKSLLQNPRVYLNWIKRHLGLIRWQEMVLLQEMIR